MIRFRMEVTPVFHLNTGVFFCEDTFLWFLVVTIDARHISAWRLERCLFCVVET